VTELFTIYVDIAGWMSGQLGQLANNQFLKNVSAGASDIVKKMRTGVGYDTESPVDKGSSNTVALPASARGVNFVGDKYSQDPKNGKFLARSAYESATNIGELAASRGFKINVTGMYAPKGAAGHQGHSKGLAYDIGTRNLQDWQQLMIGKELKKDKNVVRVLFGTGGEGTPPAAKALNGGKFQYWPGHNDHFHVYTKGEALNVASLPNAIKPKAGGSPSVAKPKTVAAKPKSVSALPKLVPIDSLNKNPPIIENYQLPVLPATAHNVTGSGGNTLAFATQEASPLINKVHGPNSLNQVANAKPSMIPVASGAPKSSKPTFVKKSTIDDIGLAMLQSLVVGC
jgi:hypothetical protein